MAPIPALVNNNTLSPRAVKQYEVNMEKELFLTKLIFGIIVAALAVFLGYVQLKPKYEKEWKPKLKPKLRDCKEKYEGWKEKMAAWPTAPAPALVADRHASEAPEVDRITCDLTPEYLKKSTAVIV
ncbi:hypothetical protein N7471_005455 [Penicillium samsonianum]|uniref:uncharacterized protein n=1 Tax=Penicillium samsonianum TaxID=1882272 RepID=UPI0025489526|nr:uncharacterized protein N7471_005455 [Penicillium samsonianum]KAJ6138969.1 hypothetical protein N7471_005455 [Penicillium samsonianum]